MKLFSNKIQTATQAAAELRHYSEVRVCAYQTVTGEEVEEEEEVKGQEEEKEEEAKKEEESGLSDWSRQSHPMTCRHVR